MSETNSESKIEENKDTFTKEYNDHVSKIVSYLGIGDDLQEYFKNTLSKLTPTDKYNIIKSTGDNLDKLEKADKELRSFLTRLEKEHPKTVNSFKELLKNLTKLQVLIFINKKSEDCTKIIDDLNKTMNNKIEAVNSIISSSLEKPSEVNSASVSTKYLKGKRNGLFNLFGGANIDDNIKYLKYKIKYLKLKNKINL
jgi:hypothetical protein